MDELHRVSLESVRPQPWRNRGGTTRELLLWPSHAAAWRVRVSVATIERSGPFSAYPDTIRWFAAIEGAGVDLELPRGRVGAAPAGEAVSFVGEAAPYCVLRGGPVLGLNLIVHREAGTARLRRAAEGDTIEGTTRWRGVYAAAPALLDVAGMPAPMDAQSLLWWDGAAVQRWQLREGDAAWFMTLEA